jgi:hypothetical protein
MEILSRKVQLKEERSVYQCRMVLVYLLISLMLMFNRLAVQYITARTENFS